VTGRRSAPAESERIEAVTTDLWYTLCYLGSADRRRSESERRRVWTEPLVAGGLSRTSANQRLRSLADWADAQERIGRAPSVDRQAAYLARLSGARIEAADVRRRLDAILLRAHVRRAPGARGALAALRSRGYRLGLVSNLAHETSGAAVGVLRDLGLDRFFGSRQFSSDLPWSKPRPEPFRRCLEELGVEPARAVHVGDRSIDRLGARRAGMRAIQYTGLHRAEFGRSRPASERPVAATPAAASWGEVLRLLPRE
jgi:HAD superfamily hydrolase (TIGR01509 family)